MQIPSTKTLRLICDRPALLRKILRATSTEEILKISEKNGLTSPSEIVARCYSAPWLQQLKMTAANEVCGTHGVEAVRYKNGRVAFEYLNAGDPYVPTLIRWNDGRTRRYVVKSWGDIVERSNKRFA